MSYFLPTAQLHDSTPTKQNKDTNTAPAMETSYSTRARRPLLKPQPTVHEPLQHRQCQAGPTNRRTHPQTDLITNSYFFTAAKPARRPRPEALMAPNNHMDKPRTHLSLPQNVRPAPPEPQARTAVCVPEPRATTDRDSKRKRAREANRKRSERYDPGG
jgi:hypothetical protein